MGDNTSVDLDYIYSIIKGYVAFNFLLMLFGSAINLWFITCILTSRDLRHRLRTQLICNLSLSSLLVTLVKAPIMGVCFSLVVHRITMDWASICRLTTLVDVLDTLQSGLGDFLLVTLILLFIASELDFDLSTRLTPGTVRILKIAGHLTPWLVITIATAVAFRALQEETPYGSNSIHYKNVYLFPIFFTISPLGISILLLVAYRVLVWRRGGGGQGAGAGNGDSRGEQLVGQAPEKDSPYVYILAVVVAAGCELCQTILHFEWKDEKFRG